MWLISLPCKQQALEHDDLLLAGTVFGIFFSLEASFLSFVESFVQKDDFLENQGQASKKEWEKIKNDVFMVQSYWLRHSLLKFEGCPGTQGRTSSLDDSLSIQARS